ncbi:CsbD family protein [Roseomonas sp. NAR14]|uniref:CsbD family protein n=1 Tax=Roseomonas acroporae TaxID=2937791 RepID=A0A9X1Y4A2_9PROT|nr:CsbD family protein [Roseomonas acroporae]MCK8783684.1 CsbD family protein [Roseomonas acroporae]
MDEHRISGMAKDAMGKVQDAVGGLAGDTRLQSRGKLRQAEGQAENAIGRFGDLIRDQPVTSVLIGLGIGYLLGRSRIV